MPDLLNTVTKDIRQSDNYARFMVLIGWEAIPMPNDQCLPCRQAGQMTNYLYVKKLPFIGSFVKGLRLNWPIDFEAIDKVVKKYRVRWVKLSFNVKTQMAKLMKNKGYRIDLSPLIPTKTVILDLRKSRDDLWREMKKDCRYAIKKAEKNGLRKKVDDDLSQFSQGFHRWRWFKGFSPLIKPQEREIMALKQAFGADCINISIHRYGDGRGGDGPSRGKNDQMLAGALFLRNQDSFHYWLAFTSDLGRKLMAQYLVVWEGIELAKKLGCQTFDFEGIADERFPKAFKSWRGFSHFKKSFGGETLTYAKPYAKRR